jgi:hypothetical protein
MPDICVSNNLTYEKLPEHRLEYIALRIKLFIHLFRIQNNRWPLDCTKLIREMKETNYPLFLWVFQAARKI